MEQIKFNDYFFNWKKLEKDIKSICKYKIKREDNKLTVMNKGKRLIIEYHLTGRLSAFDDVYWISVMFLEKDNTGHNYGLNGYDFNLEIIKNELKFF